MDHSTLENLFKTLMVTGYGRDGGTKVLTVLVSETDVSWRDYGLDDDPVTYDRGIIIKTRLDIMTTTNQILKFLRFLMIGV